MMDSEDKDFCARSHTGAVLTKFWWGGYKHAYAPLTHSLVAAKSPTGIVLFRPDGCDFWSLPGGSLVDHNQALEETVRRFEEQTGLEARRLSVLGYYRIVLPESVEYGALIFCTCDEVSQRKRASHNNEVRAWQGQSALQDLDPIAAALACVAMDCHSWKTCR